MESMPDGRSADSPSDAALAERARAGDSAAFATLWTRHSQAALRAARQFSSIADADDLVAEAYTRIFAAIGEGKGPNGAFRPYLFVTIRNLALRAARSSREEAVEDLESVFPAEGEGDPAVAALDRTLTAAAFRSLPERWQTVLWYTAVEGLSPLEASGLLGLSANSTSALAHRAREGLRQAWIQAHVSDTSASPDCRWMLAHMAKFANNGLSKHNRARALQHLAGCAGCSIVYEEIDEVSSRLALVMIPLVLGGTAGAGYLASQPGATAGQAGAAGHPAAMGHPVTTEAQHVGTALAKGRAARIAGTGVVLVLVAGSWAMIAAAQQPPRRESSSISSISRTPTHGVPETAGSAAGVTPATPPVSAQPEPAPRGPVPRGATPPPAGSPPASAMDQGLADTTALPPTITGFPSENSIGAPSLSGSAEPGANITVKDGAGTTISTVIANASGGWTTGAMTALDPRATSLSAVQTDRAGNTSAATPVGPLAFRPVILSPSGAGQVQLGNPFVFELGGWAGTRLSIALDGTDYPGSWVFDANGRQTRSATFASPGDHTVSIHYLGAPTTIYLDVTVTP